MALSEGVMIGDSSVYIFDWLLLSHTPFNVMFAYYIT